MSDNSREEYWRRNVKLITICMVIWFVVSFGFGIILKDALNVISLGGYKLGFWFAQQGSIYVFVVLIFVYSKLIGNLDKEFGVEED